MHEERRRGGSSIEPDHWTNSRISESQSRLDQQGRRTRRTGDHVQLHDPEHVRTCIDQWLYIAGWQYVLEVVEVQPGKTDRKPREVDEELRFDLRPCVSHDTELLARVVIHGVPVGSRILRVGFATAQKHRVDIRNGQDIVKGCWVKATGTEDHDGAKAPSLPVIGKGLEIGLEFREARESRPSDPEEPDSRTLGEVLEETPSRFAFVGVLRNDVKIEHLDKPQHVLRGEFVVRVDHNFPEEDLSKERSPAFLHQSTALEIFANGGQRTVRPKGSTRTDPIETFPNFPGNDSGDFGGNLPEHRSSRKSRD